MDIQSISRLQENQERWRTLSDFWNDLAKPSLGWHMLCMKPRRLVKEINMYKRSRRKSSFLDMNTCTLKKISPNSLLDFKIMITHTFKLLFTFWRSLKPNWHSDMPWAYLSIHTPTKRNDLLDGHASWFFVFIKQ